MNSETIYTSYLRNSQSIDSLLREDQYSSHSYGEQLVLIV
jgi:hypothetical protein